MSSSSSSSSSSTSSSIDAPAPQAVQKLSIQWLSIGRTRKFVDLTNKKSEKIRLEKLVEKVIEIYNQQAKIPFNRIEYPLDQTRYSVSAYCQAHETETAIAHVLGGITGLPKKSHADYILFFHRNKPRECIALTSGQAFNVVRPCINYSFPVTVAERILHPSRVLQIVRRCILQTTAKETLVNPTGIELYKTATLYYLVENFHCESKPGSSLSRLECFQPTPPSIKVSTGLLRIEQRLPLEAYPYILTLFSKYMHDEDTYSENNELETPDPGFEFLHFMQLFRGETASLDYKLLTSIFHAYETDSLQTVRLLYKNLDEYLFAESFSLQLGKGKNFCELPPKPPTLEEVLHLLEAHHKESFDKEEDFAEVLKGCKLRFKPQGGPKIEFPLINFLEGEVRVEEEGCYCKIRGNWYQLNVDYLALVQEDFKRMLRKTLIGKDDKTYLPLPWAGNKNTGRFTINVLKKRLGIKKGQRGLNTRLINAEVFFILASGKVHQPKLAGEILKEKCIQSHKDAINELLKKGTCTKTTLGKVVGKADRDTIWKALTKKRPIFIKKSSERFVINPMLPHNFERHDGLINLLEEYESLYRNTVTETEEVYSRKYLEMKNHLVFDQICPDNIEPFDVVHFHDGKAYLHHIKEKFGQPTREACSQIRNAAKEFRSALLMKQAKNFIENMFEKGVETDSKETWRLKVQEQLKEMGKESFCKLFYDQELVFVYSYLENEKQSLYYESQAPSSLSPEHLKLGSKKENEKAFQALLKAKFLDNRGRLTGKFLASSKKKFTLKGLDSEKIYDTLAKFKSVSESTLAKLELIQLEQELHNLGFQLKICPISRSGSTLASAEKSPEANGTESSDDTEKPPEIQNGPPSLKNIGNSCYINAILQLLFNMPEMRTSFETSSQDRVIARLEDVFKEPSEENLKLLRRKIFKHRKKSQLEGGLNAQHDVHELLLMLFDRLDWNPLSVNTQITQNDTKTDNPEQTNHLTLPLEQKKLQGVVNEYFKLVDMEDDDKEWQEKRSLQSQPDYLFLHLKRFDNAGQKNQTQVVFPQTQEITFPLEDGSTVNYEIVGHIHHINGNSLESGHYITYLKNSRQGDSLGEWFLCNDEDITSCGPEAVKSNNAYIVQLKRVDNESDTQ